MPKQAMNLRLEANLLAVECHHLKENESAVIDWSSFISPTRVAHSYRLTRTGNKSYLSEIRLNFTPVADETIPDAKIEKFRERIQGCLESSAPFFKGPDGKTLKIQLSTDQKVPLTTIKVTEKPIRENSDTYSLTSTCPTLIHEILHLHGLCDEYHEETIGIEVDAKTGAFKYLTDLGSTTGTGTTTAAAFDCRHLGPEPSVMRNPWAAVIESRNWATWEYEVCVGEQNSSGQLGSCGAGGSSEKRIVHQPPGSPFLEPTLASGVRILPSSAIQIGQKQASLPSIVEPAHFDVITNPGCKEENGLYYQCATNAYVSKSQPVFGGGSMTGMGGQILFNGNSACQPTPPECQNPKNWIMKNR